MPFECVRCGKCCANLGPVHIITDPPGGFSFIVTNNNTGEKTEVTVDPDKRDLFQDRKIFDTVPDACPFFRYSDGNSEAFCTVHQTRPAICREYRCWRLLILDHRGNRVGRIPYIRSLVTDDPQLRNLWDRCIEHLDEQDDCVWEDRMIRILVRAGYAVRR